MSYISSKVIGKNFHGRIVRGGFERDDLVMATPRDNPSDLSARQSAELIRDQLDTKHSQSYMLFSLDQNSRGNLPYRKEIFHNRVRWINETKKMCHGFEFRLLNYQYRMKNIHHV